MSEFIASTIIKHGGEYWYSTHFSFLYSTGSQPMECCQLPLVGIFPSLLTQCIISLTDTPRKLSPRWLYTLENWHSVSSFKYHHGCFLYILYIKTFANLEIKSSLNMHFSHYKYECWACQHEIHGIFFTIGNGHYSSLFLMMQV